MTFKDSAKIRQIISSVFGELVKLSFNVSSNQSKGALNAPFWNSFWAHSSNLSATGQNFKNVLNWLDMIKKKESGEIIKPTTNNAPPKKMPRNDYSRYEQENFNKSQTGGFQIDTLGTNASKSFNSLVAGKK